MSNPIASNLVPAWRDGLLQPLDKLEVHQLGLRHKAISVFVMAEGQTLLQRRALSKYHSPGLWTNSCCTHPYWEEPALQSAQRRLNEELNLQGLDLEWCKTVEYRAEVGNNLIEHELVEIFIAHAETSFELVPNPEEVMETRWIRMGDLLTEIGQNPSAFTPWLKIYLGEHQADIWDHAIKPVIPDRT